MGLARTRDPAACMRAIRMSRQGANQCINPPEVLDRTTVPSPTRAPTSCLAYYLCSCGMVHTRKLTLAAAVALVSQAASAMDVSATREANSAYVAQLNEKNPTAVFGEYMHILEVDASVSTQGSTTIPLPPLSPPSPPPLSRAQ